jgi:hypothetical protein
MRLPAFPAVVLPLALTLAAFPDVGLAASAALTDGRIVEVSDASFAQPALAHAGRIPARPAAALDDTPYIIVTDASLVAAFTPLAQAHTATGLPAAIHTLQEIQSAYPVAADDAERIRFFLRDAYAHGARFVLLGGDAPLIPTRIIVVDLSGTDLMVATDQYFACLDGSWDGDGDGIWGEWRDTNPADVSDDVVLTPHLAIGRAPVISVPEAEAFVAKTLGALGSQAGTGLERLLLAAGTIPFVGIDLAHDAENLLPVLTSDPGTHVTKLYKNQPAWPGSFLESPASVRDSLDAGPDLAVLTGKGGTGIFVAGGDEPADFLLASDLAALTNARPLHAVFMSAFTTLPGTASIGAALVRNPQGGAVTVLGPTNLEIVGFGSTIMRQVLEQAYVHGVSSIGEALRNMILFYTSANPSSYVGELTRLMTHGNLLLGDPALAFPGTAPDAPTAVAVSLVSAEPSPPGFARIVWSVMGTGTVTIERRTSEGEWSPVATLSPAGDGRVVYEDRDVQPGERYGYRLSFVDDGETRTAGEAWVEIPRPELALVGLTPNPSVSGFHVRFRLPDAASAALEVFDLRGRRTLLREVGGMGAGDHVLDLSREAGLAPGMYWMRLTHDGRSLVARGAVVR